ncbi:MAG: helix-turn-helix domain-containing protein [Anaerovoracaceae bacterium]
MKNVTISILIALPIYLAIAGVIVYFIVLCIKALRKYLRSGEVRNEKKAVAMSLGEALKENRERCHMTQEFVAEAIGVSRQAVSKWETGTSDPSTSNLIALAKLYDISAEELLRSVEEK